MGNKTSVAAPSGDQTVSQTWLVIDDSESESLQFDPKLSQALCVGVGEQTKLTYGNLGPAADNDAIALADVLIKSFSFPESHVQLYYSSCRHATKRRILDSLRRAARATKPRGILLVQFACHVVKLNRSNHGDEAYLVPSDYKSNWRTAISAAEIAEAVRGSSAGFLVIVMDCCHAGHIATDLVIKTDIRTYVMASCTSSQRSLSFKELGHGFFTYFLLRHLSSIHGSNGPLPTGTVTKELSLDDVDNDNGPDTRDMMRRPQPKKMNSTPLFRERQTVGIAGLLAEDKCTSWPVTSAVEYCKPLCKAIVDLVSPTFGGNLRMDPLVIRNTWTEHRDYDVTDFIPEKLDYLEKYMKRYEHTKVAPVWNHTVLWLANVASGAVSVLCKAGYLAGDEDQALYATAMAFTTQSCLHLMHAHCKKEGRRMVEELYKPLCYLEMYESMIMHAFSQYELVVKPGLTHLVYSLQHYIVMLRELERVTYRHDTLVDLLHLLTALLTDVGALADTDVTDSGGNQSTIDEVINMLQQFPSSNQSLPPPDPDTEHDSPDIDGSNGSPDSSDDNSLHSDNHQSPRKDKPTAQHSQAFIDEQLDQEQVLMNQISDNLRMS